ncbi:DUF4238 domain-containing protein [Leptospira semungkisensis]|uniref:DUF4238 domain-containing protein n=1 Tax=Leptospira semungkisensis TaxID=2484985 RepID=UPI001438283F|nr:DUF4238 domain-containing protein [Leptospira semungkisensis]
MKKKNQHFVPKFLLKNFASDLDKRQINLFNHSSGKFITSASIKHQCKRDYLYGKDLHIENAFMALETDISSILKKAMKDPKEFIEILIQDRLKIYEFVVFQYFRTTGSMQEIDEFINMLFHNMIKHDPRVSGFVDKYKISRSDPAIYNLKIGADLVNVVFDLEIALFEGDGRYFLLSDNPVIFTNPFLNLKGWGGSGLGLGCIGIIILLPISSKHCLALYDIGSYRLKKRYYHILSKNDVDRVNKISIYNSVDNIYFDTEVQKEYIGELLQDPLLRPQTRFQSQEFKEYRNKDINRDNRLIIGGRKKPQFDTNLRSIPLLSYAFNRSLPETMDPSRPYVQQLRNERNFNKHS